MSFSTVVMFSSWASGYVTLHIQSRLPSPEIGRVAAGRASRLQSKNIFVAPQSESVKRWFIDVWCGIEQLTFDEAIDQ